MTALIIKVRKHCGPAIASISQKTAKGVFWEHEIYTDEVVFYKENGTFMIKMYNIQFDGYPTIEPLEFVMLDDLEVWLDLDKSTSIFTNKKASVCTRGYIIGRVCRTKGALSNIIKVLQNANDDPYATIKLHEKHKTPKEISLTHAAVLARKFLHV